MIVGCKAKGQRHRATLVTGPLASNAVLVVKSMRKQKRMNLRVRAAG